MKCGKCGKKIVIPNGRILDRVIRNPTDLCDDCLRQKKEQEKQEREDRAKQQDTVKEASV
jgi:hypothetical protein